MIKKNLKNELNEEEIREQAEQIYYINGNFEDYYVEIDPPLGQGCSAIVKKVVSKKDNKKYAAKIVKSSEEETVFNIKYEFKI